jgi:hypothetical protein
LDAFVQISESLLSSIAELNALRDSLQKEFEFFLHSPGLNESVLKAKKNQQKIVSDLKKINEFVFDKINSVNEYIFNLQACLLYFGVSPGEVDRFTLRKKSEVQRDITEFIQRKIVQVPGSIQFAINFDQQNSMFEYLDQQLNKAEKQDFTAEKIRYANKPVFNWQNFKINNQSKQKNETKNSKI